MIDGYLKHHMDRHWDRLGQHLVGTGITANQITWLGLVLMIVACVVYQLAPYPAAFALAIGAISAFDSLDGAVARLTGTTSRYGGYLDAVLDRYQEVGIYAALGAAHDCWAAAFFAMSGALLISYNKARTAVEQPIDNVAWPDLMERMERILFLCAGLLAVAFLPWPEPAPVSAMSALLLLMGLLNHFTAIQRFMRARAQLTPEEKAGDNRKAPE